jgi:hypothetical protein
MLTMNSSKPWLMLLNKVSLFLPESSTIEKRLGRTMVGKHTTKTIMHLTTLLASPLPPASPTTNAEEKKLPEVSMFLRENLFQIATLSGGSDGISSEKYRCFFLRAPPGSALLD